MSSSHSSSSSSAGVKTGLGRLSFALCSRRYRCFHSARRSHTGPPLKPRSHFPIRDRNRFFLLLPGGTKCRICRARLAPAVFSHGRVRSAAPSGSALRGSRRRGPRAPWPPVLSLAHMYIHPHTHTYIHTCSYHRSKVGSGQMTRLQGSVCRREGKLCPRPVWFLRPVQDHKGAVQPSAADYTERAGRYTAANVHTGAHTARRAHRHVLARCRSMTGR